MVICDLRVSIMDVKVNDNVKYKIKIDPNKKYY